MHTICKEMWKDVFSLKVGRRNCICYTLVR